MVLLAGAPAVAAQTEVDVPDRISETITLAADEWKAYRLVIGSLDSLAMSATVTAGEPIDVYLLTSTGYGQYRDPDADNFEIYDPGTRENTNSFGPTVSPSAGTYYLVIDNAFIGLDGAPGDGPVTVAVSAEIRPFPVLIAALGGVVVLAIIVLVIALVVRSRRKKRAMMPPMGQPPMQPPMQPPWPPSGPPGP
jgi:hypothetical protein